jgi:dCTP deaminase
MILSDGTLRHILNELIDKPDESMINSASIDLHIGTSLLVEGISPYWIDWPTFAECTATEPYLLEPGELCLVATREWMNIPSDLAGDIKLKSSRAREGFDLVLAVHIDPGYRGRPTLEVRNNRQRNSLPLYPGFRFAQLILKQLDRPAEHPYVGRYQGATVAEGSKG